MFVEAEIQVYRVFVGAKVQAYRVNVGAEVYRYTIVYHCKDKGGNFTPILVLILLHTAPGC